MKHRNVSGIALAIVCLAGCVGQVSTVDLAAQRAEQRAITDDWIRYVDADPSLTDAQRQSRHDTAAAQDLRIRKAEESLK